RSHLFVMPVFFWPENDLPPVSRPEEPSNGPRDNVGAFVMIFPRDISPGDYDAPVFSLGGQDDYAFSPDGQEICYASNHDPEPAISTNNDLFTVPVNFRRVRHRRTYWQQRGISLLRTRPLTIPRSIRRMASTSPIAPSS